jgi:FG-GAP-like repeat
MKGTGQWRGGSLLFILLGTLSLLAHAGNADIPRPALITDPPTLPSALQVTTPKPGSTYVPGDFDGNGTSDIVWFNFNVQSQVGYWTMSATNVNLPLGGGVTRTGLRSFNVTRGYFVGAVGDLNGDGYADLVFTGANNDVWLWANDQHGGFISTQIGTFPAGWELVGAGDVDGDGYDDLLWVNPDLCQFAYWNMHGAVRTGYKIINIACGYYPIALGYFTPSNRISILWTDRRIGSEAYGDIAAHLYMWDSTGTGFKSYDWSSYVNGGALYFSNVFAIGGGYMGQGIGVQFYEKSSSGFDDAGQGFLFSRSFDEQGNETQVTQTETWSGGIDNWVGSGGYVIQGNGINATGLYLVDPHAGTIATGGLPGPSAFYSGPAPYPLVGTGSGDSWTYPSSWFVLGAPALPCYECLAPQRLPRSSP